jgi:tetratricopeptide (TPR) repeat protein
MEAVWLILLAAIPLFFNPYSIQCFEPAKAALVFVFAIVLACGLFWGGFSKGRIKQTLHHPVALAVVFFFLSQLLSSFLAVSPPTALWGSYDRAQGFVTTLAWGVFFGILITRLRHPEQMERIFFVLALSSIPVCVYGLLQRFEADIFTWSASPSSRCTSTLGNPVFLGAYLIMLMPLSLGQFFRKRRDGKSAWLYGSAFVLQLITLWACGSRGPLLGGLAGLFAWLLLYQLICGRWRIMLILLGGGILCFMLIVSRQFQASSTLETGTGHVRLEIWRAMISLVKPHAPFSYPDGSRDSLNIIRPFIGYGPECLAWVFDPFYPAQLMRFEDKAALPDRAHNETWDVLAGSGFLGFGATWWLYLALLYTGLKQSGLIRYRRDGVQLLLCGLGGAAAGVLWGILWRGPALIGLGFPLGLMGGWILYLGLCALRRPEAGARSPSSFFVIALLAGLVAHIVEIQFGFTTITTGTLFWAYAAMLVASACSEEGEASSPGRLKFGAGVILFSLAAIVIGWVVVRPVWANLLYTRGQRMQNAGNLPAALEWFQKAVRWAPLEETYHSTLGKSRFVHAVQFHDENSLDTQMAHAVQDLLQAQTLNPLRSENAANLGGLYTGWALLKEHADLRQARGWRAEAYYEQALQICSNRVDTWNERALLHMNVLANPAQAESFLQQSVRLNKSDPKARELLGELYGRLGYAASSAPLRNLHLQRAWRQYEYATELAKEGHPVSNLFDLYFRMALLCRDLKRTEWARQYAEEALRLAPAEKRGEVQAFLGSLQEPASEL